MKESSLIVMGVALLILIGTATKVATDATPSPVHPLQAAHDKAELATRGFSSDGSPPQRAPVAVPVESVELAGLRAEVARLRAELAQRDGLTVAALARARPGTQEEDVTRILGRSSLFRDSAALTLAGERATPAEIWQAIDVEDALHVEIRTLLDTMPPSSAPHAERQAWHDTVVRPRLLKASTDACNRLHDLRIPPTLVEAFRSRIEGT